MEVDSLKDSASSSEELKAFIIGGRNATPIMVKLLIDDKQLGMQVDMGAAVSSISESTLKSLLPRAILKPTDVTLTMYTQEWLMVLGELMVSVKYNQQKETLPLIVLLGEGPSLIGRNWLNCIRLD